MLFYNQVIFTVRTSNYSKLTSEISRFLKDLCSSQLWRIYCPGYQSQLQLLTAVTTLVCKECDSKPLIPGQGCGMKAGCRRGLTRGLIPLKKVHTQSGKQTTSLPTVPSQVSLYIRHETPDLECQSMDDVNVGPSAPLRVRKPTLHIMTTSTGKKSWVIVVSDFLLRVTEGPICQTDPLLRDVCCLPGA